MMGPWSVALAPTPDVSGAFLVTLRWMGGSNSVSFTVDVFRLDPFAPAGAANQSTQVVRDLRKEEPQDHKYLFDLENFRAVASGDDILISFRPAPDGKKVISVRLNTRTGAWAEPQDGKHESFGSDLNGS